MDKLDPRQPGPIPPDPPVWVVFPLENDNKIRIELTKKMTEADHARIVELIELLKDSLVDWNLDVKPQKGTD